jgi:hypothetical protein
VVSLILLLVVALTSLGGFLLATRRLGLRRAGLSWAVAEALTYLGLAVIFLIANLVVGITLVFAYRALSRQFVSVYVLNDITLPFLSLLQALVLHCWRQRPR